MWWLYLSVTVGQQSIHKYITAFILFINVYAYSSADGTQIASEGWYKI